jgi:hypothetical protein
MGFFKDYEECRSVVITIMESFSLTSQYKLALAMNVCDSLIDDKDKKYRIKQTLYSVLWEIPEAVNIGFQKYLEREIDRILKFKKYHDKNCHDIKSCYYCKNIIKTVNRISKWEDSKDERKRPTLSVK